MTEPAGLMGFEYFLLALIVIGFLVYLLLRITSGKWLAISVETLVALAISEIFIIIFLILHIRNELSTYEVVHLIAITALVLVTAIYVLRTREIAKFTKEQAEEMRLQRLAAKPFVVPDIDINTSTQLFAELSELIHSVKFPVSVTNVGKESAIELHVSLELPVEINTAQNQKYDYLTAKIPLLPQDSTWTHELFYFAYDNETEEALRKSNPPDGLYNLKVSFKSPSSPSDTPPSEITLPFSLSWRDRKVWWTIQIEKDNLIYNLADNL